MKRTLTLFLILASARLLAQTEYSSYSWNTFPSSASADTIRSVNGVAILLERRIYEIYTNKDDVFEEIFVLHRKIRVDTKDALDAENKIYVPVGDVLDIVDIEARFISPSGKITILPKGSIKEVENMDNKGDYRTFAIEGAEAGGVIEYFFILRRKFDPYGGIYVQGTDPRGLAEVIFTFPAKLTYLTKSYNGWPRFELTTRDDRSYLKATAYRVPSLLNEQYSYYKANLMRYEFTLAYNGYNSNLRAYSWAKACGNVYANLYQPGKGDESAVRSWLNKMNVPQGDDVARIRYIENQVKSQISVSDQAPAGMSLEEVIRQKQSGKHDMVGLFVTLFRMAGIPFQLVLTSDMESHPFDPDFNGFNYLEDYLVYFPASDQYLDPTDGNYRLGMIPSNYQGGYGLFMEPVSYSEKLSTLGYEVRQIPVTGCFRNADTLNLQVRLNDDQSALLVHGTRSLYGDMARTFQSFWDMMNQDRKDEVVKDMFNMGGGPIEVTSCTTRNTAPSEIGIKPFDWDVEVKAPSLVENAGDELIVKIGEVIGTQSELYNPAKRQLPVRIDVLHSYYRKIVFHIPDGYAVTNVSDLNMKVDMLNEGKTSCIFTSEARIEGQDLVITSTEYYADPDYPVSRYDEFRKVINASADFNKKTILLHKVTR